MTTPVNYVNYRSRTETLTQMNEGDSILLTPYNVTFQRESASIKSIGTKLKRKFALQSVLVVVEGELPVRFLRVTRLADTASEPKGIAEPTQPLKQDE